MSDFTATELNSLAGEMLQEVLRRTHLSAAPDIATIVAEEGRTIGAEPLVLYLLDHEQKSLVPVPGHGTNGRAPLPVQGTVAGRAFASNSIIDLEADVDGGGRRVWLPLLDGTERLGVVQMTFAVRDAPLPEGFVALCERYAHLIATLIANKDLYSDFFKLVRRRKSMTMASELLWDLVPPQVLATDTFVLAAVLEPCYDIGGDAYDYAINDHGVLHFAVFDAMGHGLAAAGATAFALAAYRHRRRRGDGPAAAYAAVDAALFEQYPQSRFVTALIAELDLASGRLRWISAGHPPPLLLRAGHLVKTLDLRPSPPLGLQLAARPPVEGEESLQPGDMVLLYTDGLTEARRPDGQLFTVERLAEFIERQAANGLPAPETLRGLREAIIERGEGYLRDDATAILVEWRRGTQQTLLPETV
jgi:serine phosphatase RsbU (regulator of sigma subunit)